MKKFFFLILLMVLSLTVSILSVAEGTPTITFSETEIMLIVGRSARVQVKTENINRSQKLNYDWVSSDPAIVEVKNGNIKGLDSGTATVTCTAALDDGTVLSASVEVTVVIPVTSVKMNSENNTIIYPGEEFKLDYTVLPENATDQSIEWKVDNEAVVEVSPNGTVRALQPGKANITGTTKDGSRRSMKISVRVPSIKCDIQNITVRDYNGAAIPVIIYGGSGYFDENITIDTQFKDGAGRTWQESKRLSQYSDEITIHYDPVVSGDVVITVKDKKDPKSQATVNVHADDSAIPSIYAILIDSISVRQGKYELSWAISINNFTQSEIAEVSYLIDFYDRFGDQRFCVYTNTGILTDYGFDNAVSLKPRKNTTLKGSNSVWTSNSPISKVRVAIVAYRFADGRIVQIPDSQLFWCDSETGYDFQNKPIITKEYILPDTATNNKADSFMIGYNYIKVYSVYSLGYAHSSKAGEQIVEINEDSLAQKCGLLKGDIIYGVDEMLWINEPYATTYGKARMKDGKEVVFHIIRNGVEKDITLKLE